MKNNIQDFSLLERLDKVKSKMLKYIMYKKRTEREVRQKFIDVEEDLLDDLIEELKEKGYIDDFQYIERSINEFISLKSLSTKEVIYKLQSKGIDKRILEEYINLNGTILEDYEKKSAMNIYNKKINNMDNKEIKLYLLKKGYKDESIKSILES